MLNIQTLHVRANPNGTFGFCGRVPHVLAHFHRERGGELTADEAANVAQCGPGLFSWCGSRTWPTADEARAEAQGLGYTVAD